MHPRKLFAEPPSFPPYPSLSLLFLLSLPTKTTPIFLNPMLRTSPASSSMAKVLHLFLLLAATVAVASSFEFRVGEAMGWRLQGSNAESFYNQWAERNRFQIGDSLRKLPLSDQKKIMLKSICMVTSLFFARFYLADIPAEFEGFFYQEFKRKRIGRSSLPLIFLLSSSVLKVISLS